MTIPVYRVYIIFYFIYKRKKIEYYYFCKIWFFRPNDCLGFVTMDNDNHWSMYFENIEMSSTNDMNPDVLGVDFTLISQIQEQINLRTQVAAMTILCMIGYGLNVLHVLTETNNAIPKFIPQKERRRQEVMSYLIHTERCRDIIRMSPEAFINLCQRIRGTGMVKDAFRSTVEEQVANSLHNIKNRSVSFFFHQSGETVSRHFHNVLKAILMLHGEFLIQPAGTEVEPHILNNNRFFPYFKV